MDAEIPSPHEAAAERFERQQLLESIRHELTEVRDKLDHPIDSGIIEAVAGLQAHRIGTTQSCEGHDDRALALPWVDIGAPELPGWKDDPKVAEQWKSLNEAAVRRAAAALERRKMSRENEQRPLQPPEILILDPKGVFGAARLESPDQNAISKLDEGGRAAKAPKHRLAMKEFGEFLKSDFLEHGSYE